VEPARWATKNSGLAPRRSNSGWAMANAQSAATWSHATHHTGSVYGPSDDGVTPGHPEARAEALRRPVVRSLHTDTFWAVASSAASPHACRATSGPGLYGPVIARGINSLELFWDGQRWWIVANLWDQERAGNPIPGEFLPRH